MMNSSNEARQTQHPTPNTQRLQAVLFDLDGTLVDTHGLIMTCYEHAAQTHLGRPMRREIWEERVGIPLDDVLIAVCEYYAVLPTPDLIAALCRAYRGHMRAHADDIRAFPGIIEMLTDLRERKVRLAIVTTKHRPMAVRHLETSGLTDFFEFIIAGDDVHKPKPDPEPFWRALERLRLAPEHVAHVGDSQHDVNGAKAAGIYAIAALWGADNRPALLAASPDTILAAPEQLISSLLHQPSSA